MGLVMEGEKARRRIRVLCDECGEPINSGDDGNAIWDMNFGRKDWPKDELPHGRAPMMFTHKKCDYAHEQKHGPTSSLTNLAELPARLIADLGVSLDETAKDVRSLADLRKREPSA